MLTSPSLWFSYLTHNTLPMNWLSLLWSILKSICSSAWSLLNCNNYVLNLNLVFTFEGWLYEEVWGWSGFFLSSPEIMHWLCCRAPATAWPVDTQWNQSTIELGFQEEWQGFFLCNMWGQAYFQLLKYALIIYFILILLKYFLCA